MELTMPELLAFKNMLINEMAENEAGIIQLEKLYPDYVSLYNSSAFQKRLNKRDVLGGMFTKLIEATAQKDFQEKILSN